MHQPLDYTPKEATGDLRKEMQTREGVGVPAWSTSLRPGGEPYSFQSTYKHHLSIDKRLEICNLAYNMEGIGPNTKTD